MAGTDRARQDTGHLDVATRRSRPERHLELRIARLPEAVRPFFEDFHDFVRNEARDYAAENRGRRRPRDFRAFIRRFLELFRDPLDATQLAVITLGYRAPAPLGERAMKTTAVAISAGATGYGQTLTYGSAFSATAGALAVGVVTEMIELYELASARTLAYQWAGLYPGVKVIADDLAQISSKDALKVGTLRHVGDELVGELLDRFGEALADTILVPLIGPVHAGYGAWRGLNRAYGLALTKPGEGEDYRREPEADFSAPRFGDVLAWAATSRRNRNQLGWLSDR
jgi:hypothetical protein